MTLVLECKKLGPEWANALAEFFVALKEVGDEKFFHPHPLSYEEAHKLAQYSGNDLYYVLVESERVLGYGILRGWDEGYRVPSLGIAIHPSERGLGLAKVLMHFLHGVARLNGATQIRLKTYPGNLSAVKLYKDLGYAFEGTEAGQMVGVITL